MRLKRQEIWLPRDVCNLWCERARHLGTVWVDLTVGSDGKKSCLEFRSPGFNPWVGKMPWRRKWQPAPVFLPEEFHGQRCLVVYTPWGCHESHTIEQRTPPQHKHRLHAEQLEDKRTERSRITRGFVSSAEKCRVIWMPRAIMNECLSLLWGELYHEVRGINNLEEKSPGLVCGNRVWGQMEKLLRK